MIQQCICLITLALSFYSLDSSSVPHQLDQYFKSRHLGYASFSTIWTMYFTIITLISRLVYLHCRGFLKYTASCAFELFFTVSFCYSLVITVAYWPIVNMNYYYMYPKLEGDARMPLFTDMCYHLFPFLTLLLLRNWCSMNTSLVNVFFIWIVGIGYQLTGNYMFLVEGRWPYPFMNNLGCVTVNLIFFSGHSSAVLLFLIMRKFGSTKKKH